MLAHTVEIVKYNNMALYTIERVVFTNKRSGCGGAPTATGAGVADDADDDDDDDDDDGARRVSVIHCKIMLRHAPNTNTYCACVAICIKCT